MSGNEWMSNVLAASGKGPESDVGSLWGDITHPGRVIKRTVNVAKETVSKVGQGNIRGAVKGVGRHASATSRDIAAGLSGVPAVGPGLHALYQLSPAVQITLAANIAAGKRIDRAAYEALKTRIKAYQDIAPYAQTVISFVPGVGQGISGAIGAANALSKGQPISEAMIQGVRGALPGGPMAQAAFDVAVAGIQGKPLTEVALSALPLDPEQKKLVIASALAAKDIAEGKNVSESLYTRGRVLLPPEAQKALDIGVAIAQGQKLQKIAKDQIVQTLPQLVAIGAHEIGGDEVLKSGLDALKNNPEVAKGFATGVGFLKHKATPAALIEIRKNLPPAVKKGFDIAASAQVGKVALPLPKKIPPAQRFGYYVTQGLHGGNPKTNAAMAETLIKHPEVKKGMKAAAREINHKNKKKQGFWQWLKDVLEIG